MKHGVLIASLCAALALAFAGVRGASAAEKKGPPTHTARGELTKIEGKSLTVTSKGDSGEKSVTVTADDSTKILLPSDKPAAGGKEGAKGTQHVEGKLSDLKVGDRVSVTYKDDNTATRIEVGKPQAPKESKEGHGAPKTDTPKEKKEGK